MNFIIGEFNIVCKNLNESITFYEDILNFKLIEKGENYAHFEIGSKRITLLAFAEQKKAKLTYGATTTFSLDLRVKNLEEAREYFKLKKIHFANTHDNNDDYFAIYDPNHLIWEVVQA